MYGFVSGFFVSLIAVLLTHVMDVSVWWAAAFLAFNLAGYVEGSIVTALRENRHVQ